MAPPRSTGRGWRPTPFLSCTHHTDRFPAGDGRLGPAAGAPSEGWSRYFGPHVPGFPAHPHRGFETITFVRQGLVDHADSLGAAGRYGHGDVQWLTAGAGVVHAEMFPLVDTEAGNPLDLFQIWLNLPATSKMTAPWFGMLWAEQLPHLVVPGSADVTVIAGALDGLEPPAPPPASWAARPDSDLAVWHLALDAGGRFALPPAAGAETVRTLYAFEGGIDVDGTPVPEGTAVSLDARRPVPVAAGGSPARALLLQGRPIGDPVVARGSFVMNTEQQIAEAVEDYQRTGFGGWPWPGLGPTHGLGGRFARYPDGREETPEGAGQLTS